MNIDMIVHAVLCVLMLWVSSHHSREALFVAIAMTIGFLFYITAWAPYGLSPRALTFALTGEKIKSAFFWAMSDSILLLYVAWLVLDRFWGGLVVMLYMIQVCFHIVKIYEFIIPPQYLFWLDRTFDMQIAIMILAGIVPTIIFQWARLVSFSTWLRKYINQHFSNQYVSH